MRTLSFIVSGQTIKKDRRCSFSGLVAGSKDYLRASFEFDSDWDGCLKFPSFWCGDSEIDHVAYLESDNTCRIPAGALVGEEFQVSVSGGRPDGYRITTNKTKVRQEVT